MIKNILKPIIVCFCALMLISSSVYAITEDELSSLPLEGVGSISLPVQQILITDPETGEITQYAISRGKVYEVVSEHFIPVSQETQERILKDHRPLNSSVLGGEISFVLTAPDRLNDDPPLLADSYIQYQRGFTFLGWVLVILCFLQTLTSILLIIVTVQNNRKQAS